MKALEETSSIYNQYVNTAIDLCAISYKFKHEIAREVGETTKLKVVWGPYESKPIVGISDSLMYVANDHELGEYYVVIRGTNPFSATSWLDEDFKVGSSRRFSDLPGSPPNVGENVLISEGTFFGMSLLLGLKDDHDHGIVDFLKQVNPKRLYVTGHSLGGTLTPPLFAYLNAMLYGGARATNIGLWSFAGLTAGGSSFNNYLNGMFNPEFVFKWRIQNSLDIAPLLWESQDRVENIYSSHHLEWGDLEKKPIENWFSKAKNSGIDYSQPQIGNVMQGGFDGSIVDKHLWAAQASHQHHSKTYQKLVKENFPLS